MRGARMHVLFFLALLSPCSTDLLSCNQTYPSNHPILWNDGKHATGTDEHAVRSGCGSGKGSPFTCRRRCGRGTAPNTNTNTNASSGRGVIVAPERGGHIGGDYGGRGLRGLGEGASLGGRGNGGAPAAEA